ncbi:MAG: CpaF/VirB11 family protein [Renibacterium salmoninarum]|nr:CpaF/VirB11 family protein [Renibacterium salmoninarum]
MTDNQIDPTSTNLSNLPIFATGIPAANEPVKSKRRNPHFTAAALNENRGMQVSEPIETSEAALTQHDGQPAIVPAAAKATRQTKASSPRARYLRILEEKQRRRHLPWHRVDWAEVKALQGAVAAKIVSFQSANPRLPEEVYEVRGRDLIAKEVAVQSKAQYSGEVSALAPTGSRVWDSAYEALLIEAVFVSQFRLGRLQLLLDLEDIEDVMIHGYDNVYVRKRGGLIVAQPPVAESDEELVGMLQRIGQNNPEGSRTISEAYPMMNTSLPGGERLAAVMQPIEKRPNIVIRIHNLIDVTLQDMIQNETCTTAQAKLLTAAVLSGRNIVVAGLPAAGKTTFLRSLVNVLDPYEALVTIETERELHLDLMDDRHYIVMPWQAVEGDGELRADGSRVGDIGQAELVHQALRHSVTRLLVGEVRSKEIAAMFAASKAGAGSLSTVHARSADNAIERLARMFEQSAPGISSNIAYGEVAENVDFIVHLLHRPDGKGGKRRYIAEIAEIVSGERHGMSGWPVVNSLFKARSGEFTALPESMPSPETLQHLEDYGWDRHEHAAQTRGVA